MSLFKVPQIDILFLDLLQIKELKILCQVNKHYKHLIKNHESLKDLYLFFEQFNPARIIDVIKSRNIKIYEYFYRNYNTSIPFAEPYDDIIVIMNFSNKELIQWFCKKYKIHLHGIHYTYMIEYNDVDTIYDVLSEINVNIMDHKFALAKRCDNYMLEPTDNIIKTCNSAIFDIIEKFNLSTNQIDTIYDEIFDVCNEKTIMIMSQYIQNPGKYLQKITDRKNMIFTEKFMESFNCDEVIIENVFNIACEEKHKKMINYLLHNYKFDKSHGIIELCDNHSLYILENLDSNQAFMILKNISNMFTDNFHISEYFIKITEILDETEQRKFIIMCINDDIFGNIIIRKMINSLTFFM